MKKIAVNQILVRYYRPLLATVASLFIFILSSYKMLNIAQGDLVIIVALFYYLQFAFFLVDAVTMKIAGQSIPQSSNPPKAKVFWLRVSCNILASIGLVCFLKIGILQATLFFVATLMLIIENRIKGL